MDRNVANTFDDPGGNLPDAEGRGDDVPADPFGAATAPGGEQQQPIMDEDPVSDDSRLSGMVAQVRADLAGQPRDRIEHELRRRMADAGITAPDETVQALTDAAAASALD